MNFSIICGVLTSITSTIESTPGSSSWSYIFTSSIELSAAQKTGKTLFFDPYDTTNRVSNYFNANSDYDSYKALGCYSDDISSNEYNSECVATAISKDNMYMKYNNESTYSPIKVINYTAHTGNHKLNTAGDMCHVLNKSVIYSVINIDEYNLTNQPVIIIALGRLNSVTNTETAHTLNTNKTIVTESYLASDSIYAQVLTNVNGTNQIYYIKLTNSTSDVLKDDYGILVNAKSFDLATDDDVNYELIAYITAGVIVGVIVIGCAIICTHGYMKHRHVPVTEPTINDNTEPTINDNAVTSEQLTSTSSTPTA